MTATLGGPDPPEPEYVECTRCHRMYPLTPWDDHYEPADDLGWTGGKVCTACLLELWMRK